MNPNKATNAIQAVNAPGGEGARTRVLHLIGSSAGVGRRSPEWCPGRNDQELLRGRSRALGVASEDGEAAEDGLLPAAQCGRS